MATEITNQTLDLTIDPEFEQVCPPLTEEEFQQLRKSILEDREIYMPIMVWNGTVVDGHHRYKILKEDPTLAWTTRQKYFEDRAAAMAWICENQLGRRNLTPEQKKFLIGKKYEAEKHTEPFRGNQYTSPERSGPPQNVRTTDSEQVSDDEPEQNIVTVAERTSDRLAREMNVSRAYVERSALFSKGLDAAEEVHPGIRKEILLGKIKATDAQIIRIGKVPQEERQTLVEMLLNPPPKIKPICPPPSRPSRKEIIESHRQTQKIYQEMLNPNKTVSSESALVSVEGAVEALIQVCESLFRDFPQLLTDVDCKAQVIEYFQLAHEFMNEVAQDGYGLETAEQSSEDREEEA